MIRLLSVLCLLLPVTAFAQDAPAPRPVVSEIVVPASGLTSTWVGTVASPRELDLGFPQIGTVAELLVRLGDTVRRGDVLARQDPGDLDAAVRAADAGVTIAEAQLRTARDAMDRTRELVARGVSSTSAEERAATALSSAEAQLEQARATLAQAEDARAYADLTAPQDGIVTEVFAEAGATLSAGEALLSLASVDEREVLVDMTDEDLATLQVGTEFRVALEVNSAITATATLTSVDTLATRSTRTRSAHLTLDRAAPSGFRLGALVEVRVAGADSTVMSLPLTALIAGAEPASVWVVDPAGRSLVRTTIETGPSAGGRVAVLSGLTPGAEVLTRGVNSVEAGQVVGERVGQ